MEAWADMRGHLPARENTGGPAVDGHLISTDPVALPVLILLFGQEYVEGDGDAPSQHWYDNITSAAVGDPSSVLSPTSETLLVYCLQRRRPF